MTETHLVPASRVREVQEDLEDERKDNERLRKSINRIDTALQPVDTTLWTIEPQDDETNTMFRIRGLIESGKFFSGQVGSLLRYIAKLEQAIGREQAQAIRSALEEDEGEEIAMYDAPAIMERLASVEKEFRHEVYEVRGRQATVEEQLETVSNETDKNDSRLDDVESQLKDIDNEDLQGQIENLEDELREKLDGEDVEEIRDLVAELEERVKKLFPENSKERKLKATIAGMLSSRGEKESDEDFAARVLATVRREDQDGK
jgi:phosphoenolpyruvate synthase/pyruvate phosphate dikinase